MKNNVHGKEDVPDRNVEVKPDIGSGPKKVYNAQTMWHSFNDDSIKIPFLLCKLVYFYSRVVMRYLVRL